MSEEVQKLIQELRDTEIGWVTRRDAAENLGKIAVDAVEALRQQADDPDVDIRDAVRRAAGWASGALQGIKPFAEVAEHSLHDLVKDLGKKGSRTVTTRGKGYDIKVELSDGRSQTVNIVPIKPQNRPDSIRVSTKCGAPTKDAYYTWALRTNMSTVQCAIALTEENGEEMFVMANCFLASHVSPAELKAAVKEIAFYGDWIEKEMTGADNF